LATVIRFQKALELVARATIPHEAEAAELAARRIMLAYSIDPVLVPNGSFYDRTSFADNPLLAKLREEWRAGHPEKLYYSRGGIVRERKTKPRKRKVEPVDVHAFDGLFDDFMASLSEEKP
jgi:hypothetical protein